MSVIIFNRLIGPVAVDVILSEDHESSIEITAIPIENGAEVNDHAYRTGKRLKLQIADGTAADTHAALIRFQESRTPFTIITGLRIYKNMLMLSVRAQRDRQTARILSGDIDLQEVLIANTAGMAGDIGGLQVDGPKELRSSSLNAESARDPLTKLRTSGTVRRGDNPFRESNDATALAVLARI